MKKIIIIGILITGLIIAFFQFDNIKMQITELVSGTQTAFIVGECVNAASEVAAVPCDSESAAYVITSVTDSSGATCAEIDNGVITQKRTGSTSYYCVQTLVK